MARTALNIVYVTNRNGKVTAQIENGAMETSSSVGELLQMLGSMNKIGPASQLFISVDPGRKLSDLGLQQGSTIIIMGK